MKERRKWDERETKDIVLVIFQKVTGYKNKFRIGGR